MKRDPVRRALTAVMSNLVLLVAAPVIFHVQAQTSPAELAQTVVERWSAGAEKRFASVYPFREGRDALSAALGAKSRRLDWPTYFERVRGKRSS